MSAKWTKRRVYQIATTYDPVCVKVHLEPALAEYRARLYVRGSAIPSADYFTDDLDDARRTARHMFAHATDNLKG